MAGEVQDVLLSIPRIYTTIAQFFTIFLYLMYSPKKHTKNKRILMHSFFFIAFISFQYWVSTWNLNLWIFGIILSVALMFIYIYVVSDNNIFTSAYITILAFIVSELVASLAWQLEYFLIVNNNIKFFNFLIYSSIRDTIYDLSFTLIMVITYLVVFTLFYYIEKRYQKNKRVFEVKSGDLISAGSIAIIIFTISNLSFLNINTPISSNNAMEIFYIRTLVDLVGVIFLYSQREHKYSTQNILEVNLMRSLLEKQYEQYQSSTAAYDNINRKYHDLRHHIEVIKNEIDFTKKNEHLVALEESIKTIERTYETNNRVIDVILNSKEEVLRTEQINLTVVADAKHLEFILGIDLVAIFSNAIDNAIDGLRQVKEIEKRLMKIVIAKQSGFIVIKIENYYESPIKIVSGKFISTKGDEVYHGYGIKSIIHAVDKYNGNIKIDTDNNWFTLAIVIPVP